MHPNTPNIVAFARVSVPERYRTFLYISEGGAAMGLLTVVII